MGRNRSHRSHGGTPTEDRDETLLKQPPITIDYADGDDLVGQISSWLLAKSEELFLAAKSASYMERAHLKGMGHTVKRLAFTLDNAVLNHVTAEMILEADEPLPAQEAS